MHRKYVLLINENNVFIYLFYFWLRWVFVAVHRLSPVATSRRYSLAVAHGLLVAVASVVLDHGLRGLRASVVVVHGFSCLRACGVFPKQGSNPCPPHRQVDSYPLGSLGKLFRK